MGDCHYVCRQHISPLTIQRHLYWTFLPTQEERMFQSCAPICIVSGGLKYLYCCQIRSPSKYTSRPCDIVKECRDKWKFVHHVKVLPEAFSGTQVEGFRVGHLWPWWSWMMPYPIYQSCHTRELLPTSGAACYQYVACLLNSASPIFIFHSIAHDKYILKSKWPSQVHKIFILNTLHWDITMLYGAAYRYEYWPR